jgi:hypothetical protein
VVLSALRTDRAARLDVVVAAALGVFTRGRFGHVAVAPRFTPRESVDNAFATSSEEEQMIGIYAGLAASAFLALLFGRTDRS